MENDFLANIQMFFWKQTEKNMFEFETKKTNNKRQNDQ